MFVCFLMFFPYDHTEQRDLSRKEPRFWGSSISAYLLDCGQAKVWLTVESKSILPEWRPGKQTKVVAFYLQILRDLCSSESVDLQKCSILQCLSSFCFDFFWGGCWMYSQILLDEVRYVEMIAWLCGSYIEKSSPFGPFGGRRPPGWRSHRILSQSTVWKSRWITGRAPMSVASGSHWTSSDSYEWLYTHSIWLVWPVCCYIFCKYTIVHRVRNETKERCCWPAHACTSAVKTQECLISPILSSCLNLAIFASVSIAIHFSPSDITCCVHHDLSKLLHRSLSILSIPTLSFHLADRSSFAPCSLPIFSVNILKSIQIWSYLTSFNPIPSKPSTINLCFLYLCPSI